MNSKKTSKMLAFLLIIMMMAVTLFSTKVQAATINNVDVVFNAEYYLNRYGDLKAAFGNDAQKAYWHFINWGIDEGRCASEIFDVKYYLQNNKDIADFYGAKNYRAALNHFINWGITEGRKTSTNFNVKHYLNANKDIKNAFGEKGYYEATRHYTYWGVNENRTATHNFDKEIETTGICTEGRTIVKQCTCGATNIETVAATEHIWNVGEVTKEPTCAAPGEQTYTCTVCGTTKTEEISATEHAYGEPVITWAEDGYTATAEVVCANDETHTLPVDVEVTSEITKAATCTETGIKTYTATAVFEDKTITDTKTETLPIDPDNHDYQLDEIIDEATCTKEGKAMYVCSRCKAGEERAIEKKEHEYIQVYKQEPTCTEEGYTIESCKVCQINKEETIAINPDAHAYGEEPVFTWTETEDGYTATAKFVCANDPEHTKPIENVVVTSENTATCEEAGEITYTATATTEDGTVYTDTTEPVATEATEHAYGEPIITWAEDGYTATAEVVCANDETHTLPVDVEVTSEITKEATCTDAGERTYTATATYGDKTVASTKTETIEPQHNWETYKTINEATCGQEGVEKQICTICNKTRVNHTDKLPHAYGEEPVFTWTETENGYTATAKFVCANDETHIETIEDVKVTSETTATCDAAGVTTYTATATTEDGTEYTATKEVNTPALEHEYGNVEWNWSDDNTTATATKTCSRCNNILSENATVVSDPHEATCTDAGYTIYTATATIDGEEKTDTKRIEGAAALEHAYGEPVWNWNEDNTTATATFTCANDSTHVETVNATVTSKTTDATCETAGQTVYTATVTFNGEEKTDTKTVPINALEHNYGEPVWNWSKDKTTATATFTCANNPTHVETVTAKLAEGTIVVTSTDATCENKEKITYTATVTFGETDYTNSIDVDGDDALGHAYGEEPVWNWSDDNTTATAKFVCANDETHIIDLGAANVTSEITKKATCIENGEITYTATVVYEGETYTDTKTETIAKLNENGNEHIFGDSEMVIIKEPTTETEGEGLQYCPKCKETVKVVIPKLAK